MTELKNAACIADLAEIAERRLPDFAYRYFAGGAGDDGAVKRNEAAFAEVQLRAFRLRGITQDTSTEVFGRRYDQPFGMPPIGIANVVWPGTDAAMFAQAKAHNLPVVVGTAGTSTIEYAASVCPDQMWFQLYMSQDAEMTQDLMKRAWDSGIRTLVWTIDTPVVGRRNGAIRSSFTIAVDWTPHNILELMMHPRWALTTFFKGKPTLANFEKYGGTKQLMVFGISKSGVLWEDLQLVRESWKGKMVVKGIMEPEDATEIMRYGVDGLWVSNHGGRQLESGATTIAVLPSIRAAIGPDVPLFVDSGVRTGDDVVKALASGADLVFAGRPFLFGGAAGGAAGVQKAVEILKAEYTCALAQVGCPKTDDLDSRFLVNPPKGGIAAPGKRQEFQLA